MAGFMCLASRADYATDVWRYMGLFELSAISDVDLGHSFKKHDQSSKYSQRQIRLIRVSSRIE
jgi:hypothetical protein